MKNSVLLSGLVLICSINRMTSQEAISDEKNNKIKISGYIDSYFSAYSNDLSQQEFQPLITVGARDNSFGVNIVAFTISYEHEWVRGNITMHWGDIPQATWNKDFNQIQEANIGFKLTEGLWLDAGFFRTHIGTESFLPKNNLLSSTAFITYNEPFYQAGAKLSYDIVKNWHFEMWALNGYNNFVDTNDAKSIGMLANYTISKRTSITYTNLYGRESTDDMEPKQNRFYQNIYINQNWNEKIFLIAGFDYGMQTHSQLDNLDKTASMYGALATLRYQYNPKWSVTGRGEIFKDTNGFISGMVENDEGEPTGIELTGFTLGTEFKPVPNAYIRAEGRFTGAKNALDIFVENGTPTNHRYEFLVTMGINIEKAFGF